MMLKKYLIFAVILAGVLFGFFLLSFNRKTFYIKNSAPYLPALGINKKIYQADDKIGDLSNTVVPSIKVPQNLTESFAGLLATDIIGKNNQPKNGNPSALSVLNVPTPNKIAENFIKNGLIQANENILNIEPPKLKISSDNSTATIESYLAEVQKIIKDNLNGEPVVSILQEINKNNGQGIEKLLPIIAAHEAAANQLEKVQLPSDLKNLMTEEIRLLRITANILRALTNVENDPLGTIAATKQFNAVLLNWAELQKKFNFFIEKFNKTQ